MELICPVKKYHWGKRGSSSLIAQLKQCSDSNFTLSEDDTYAELWMGTHPSGAAFLKDSTTLLGSWLQKNLSKLGEATQRLFGNDLPFLFKILSINMPLSIQVHPSKSEAEKLHEKYPEIYRDPNHKPELAIALTNFEAMCGFRPVEEIKKFFNLIPEFREVVGKANANEFLSSNESNIVNNLKKCFVSLMNASEIVTKTQLELLLNRIKSASESIKNEGLAVLLNQVHDQFPGDVGCFCIYFFNYVVLKPGEAIYLGANEPHAYISGDCVECMACSDNVVRAGLTPKPRDVDTLCRILNYSPNTAKSKLLIPEIENDCSTVYRPPAQEFAVCKLLIPPGCEYKFVPRNSPSIFIVIKGCGILNGANLSGGQVFFMGANEFCSIQVFPAEPLLIFQAFVNI